MAQRSKIEVIFSAIDQVTSPVRRMARNVAAAAGRIESKLSRVNGALGRVGDGMRNVGAIATVAGATVATAFGHAIGVGAEYEQTLINAAQRLGEIRKGTAAFDELSDAALAMSSVTEFGAKDAAGALEFMGTAGERAKVAMGTLKIFADSATAGKVSLARAADIASDSIGLLGLSVTKEGKALSDTQKIQNYTRVVDLMTAAHSGANLTLNQVFETTKKAGKIFTTSGQSVETFLAATQALSESIKGADAGTALRGIVRNIFATTGEASKVMKKLRDEFGKRIKLTDVDGNIRALPDILKDVNKGLERFSDLKQKQLKAKLFGEFEAAGTLLLSKVDDVRARTVKLNDVMGKTAKLAAVGRDSTAGAFKTLASTIEVIEIEVFNIIKNDVQKITKAVIAWAKANKAALSETVLNSIEFMRDNFDDIVRIAPRMLKFIAVLWALVKVLTVIEVVMSLLAAVGTVTAGTLGIVVVAVVALIAVVALLIIYWDDVVAAMEIAWQFLVDKLVGALEWVTELWNTFMADLRNGDPTITAIAVILGTMLAPLAIMIGFFPALAYGISQVVEHWDWLVAQFQAGDPVVVGLTVVLASLFAPILALLAPVIALGVAAKTLIDNWTEVSTVFKDIWAEIEDSFFKSLTKIDDKLTSFKSTLNDFLPGNLFDVETKVRAKVEAVDGVRGANLTLGQQQAIERGERLANPFLGGPNTQNPANNGAQAQVVDTRAESIIRSITEEKESVDVNVTVRDRGGNVESIEQQGGGDRVQVTSSGEF